EEDVIEPGEHVAARRSLGGARRILELGEAAVPDRSDHEPALAFAACAAVVVDSHEGVDGALQEDVVPAAGVYRRRPYLAGLGLGVERLPEIVVARVGHERL